MKTYYVLRWNMRDVVNVFKEDIAYVYDNNISSSCSKAKMSISLPELNVECRYLTTDPIKCAGLRINESNTIESLKHLLEEMKK